LLVVPLIYRDQVEGVLELAWLTPPPASHRTFLERAGESVAVALASARSLAQIRTLLTTSQQQEEELRVQQEELTQINEELEEQSTTLIERSRQAEEANRAIEAARQDLQRQTEQLALSSKYKSEFLSNMSHELRTPLNSLLILSQQLYENPKGNLDEKQVRYARTINSSGNDLLTLINDILDLAKIESGTVTLDPSDVRLSDLCDDLDRQMRPLAEQKHLDFAVRLGADVPAALRTDGKRLHQVLKNLVSNALKFTATSPGRQGSVVLSIDAASGAWSAHHPQAGQPALTFSVSDNGIGIAPDKQALVFEAFQQADGGVSRRFGGTGLGLSISRELAHLLGGELRLVSTVGEGSTFALVLPVTAVLDVAAMKPVERPGVPLRAMPPLSAPVASAQDVIQQPSLVEDDRASIVSGDRVVLIVEDDLAFARILVDLAREQGFKAVVSLRGAGVPALTRELKPDAITLDIHLADGNGWHLLDRLKNDPHTRHIPVHVITVDDERSRALRSGAVGALTKPATRDALAKAFAALMRFRDQQKRHLLVVEDDETTRQAIVDTIGNGDVFTTAVGDAEAALAALGRQPFDCIVLDLGLPGMSGQRLLDALHDHPQWRDIPVIIYTARDLGAGEEQRLRRTAKTIVLKTAASLDRLLDETALFLHRVHSRLPEGKRQRIERARQTDSALSGHTVLVADDDVRNVFALTSLLERYGMNVVTAENGREALARLSETPAVSLVLMDIMMPEMDGYTAMRAIRAEAKWQNLPILALTAKAMKGDREQCLAAGASDYITKPVDSDQLLSMLRVWLYR
jgi:CheY-like chemotaxis protein